ncbi:CoB--CoM heterodisulfide reductase iron-sulfur subunit A family protein [Marinilabiliaceae bacterium JC017]|nr:CoB--CoM heterodisulfide reductase iron-sulfur subunit A family protein [Marinilabiliaceae bacterium JC017]
MKKHNTQIIIIGGGLAGLEAAKWLVQYHYKVVVMEQEKIAGGHVVNWHSLYPGGIRGDELINNIFLTKDSMVQILTNQRVTKVEKRDNFFWVHTSQGERLFAEAVLLTTGFKLFNAALKEELGYGIFPNVVTSAEVEQILASRMKPPWQLPPRKVAIIHCVGSRDMKAGNMYCSKVCCMAGVKTAIHFNQQYPMCKVYNFYMDLRMHGNSYEALYLKAQTEYGVQFIRGRVSELSADQYGRLVLKSEDTLLGKPLKLTVDVVVLMVGMEQRKGLVVSDRGKELAAFDGQHFYEPLNAYDDAHKTCLPGLFLGGACKGPMSATEVIVDARAAVQVIDQYLQNN